MEGLLLPLALLACPVGMGVMMYFMSRAMTGGGHQAPAQPSRLASGGDPEMRLAVLQAERELLETKIRLVEEQGSQGPVRAARDEARQ